MYALIQNGSVVKYPYTIDELKQSSPNTSFPTALPPERLADYGVFTVVSTGAQYDQRTQVAESAGCAYNADRQRWETAWSVRDKTADEMQADTAAEATKVRAQRNQKLAESDWTQVLDAPVDKAAWATYRQALRDITAQPGFPWTVTWPNEP
jgi:hypothetical protein